MKTFPRGASAALMILSLMAGGARAVAGHPAMEYGEGDVIVTFKPAVNLTAARQTLNGHSLGWRRHFDGLSRQRGKETGLVHAQSRTTAQLIAELSRDPAVETAEPNYLRWVTSTTPNDTYFTDLWAMENSGQPVIGTAGTAGDGTPFFFPLGGARPPPPHPPPGA